jgi:hypothetical protein
MERRLVNTVIRAGLVFLLTALSSVVHADTRVVVRNFTGPSAQVVRKEVVRVLSQQPGVKVVDTGAADSAARRRGVDLDGAAGKQEVAREIEITAWVEGKVERRAGKLHTRVIVIDANTSGETAKMVLVKKKPKQLTLAMRKQVWKRLGSAIKRGSAPEGDSPPANEPSQQEPDAVASADDAYSEEGSKASDSESESAEEPTERAVASASSEAESGEDAELIPGLRPLQSGQRVDGDQNSGRSKYAPTALEINLAMAVLNRSLRFNQPVSAGLSDYSLGAAPVANMGMRLYPGAFFSEGWPSYIGLDVGAQLGFGVETQNTDGTRFPTKYDAYSAGLIGRYPFGAGHDVHALAGYGVQRFQVSDSTEGEAAPVPDVDYRAARFGAGGKLRMNSRLAFGLDATWLMINSFGELGAAEWFPGITGSGVQGELFADLSMWKTLCARAGVSYQREFFSFNSKPGDTRVAGGASDDYLYASLGLGYSY